MGRRVGRGLGLALALAPFCAGVLGASVVCGAELAPPPKGDSVDSIAPSEPSEPSPAKTQEITYEPWELVST